MIRLKSSTALSTSLSSISLFVANPSFSTAGFPAGRSSADPTGPSRNFPWSLARLRVLAPSRPKVRARSKQSRPHLRHRRCLLHACSAPPCRPRQVSRLRRSALCAKPAHWTTRPCVLQARTPPLQLRILYRDSLLPLRPCRALPHPLYRIKLALPLSLTLPRPFHLTGLQATPLRLCPPRLRSRHPGRRARPGPPSLRQLHLWLDQPYLRSRVLVLAPYRGADRRALG